MKDQTILFDLYMGFWIDRECHCDRVDERGLELPDVFEPSSELRVQRKPGN